MMSILNYVLILIPVISVVNPIATYEDERLLQATLLSNYSKHIRPVIDLTKPVNIDTFILLHTLYDLDFVNNILIAWYLIGQKWNDELLRWNPEEYNNITSINLPKDKIWAPDIIMCNSMSETEDEDIQPKVRLHFNGRLETWSQKVVRTFCPVDAYTYPFDEHACEICISVAVHEPRHTRIKSLTYTDLKFIKNYQWDIDTNDKVNSTEGMYSYATGTIYLRRKLTLAIIAMLIPTAMMTILTICVFILPPESGEKVSLATTIFLSNVLYLVEIEKTTPKNSKSPSLLMLYLLLLSMSSGITTLGSVVISKLYVNQSAKEKKSTTLDQNNTKPRGNKIADVSLIPTAQSDPDPVLKEKSSKNRWFCVSDYVRLDGMFLKVSFVLSIIVATLFTYLMLNA